MAKGGTREGAGNKLGSVRPKMTDYWSQEDIEDYFTWLKGSYKTDATLAKFVGEHLMGKAVQPLGNDDGQPLVIQLSEVIAKKHALNQSPD